MLHRPDHDHLVRLDGILDTVRESVDEVASNVGRDGSPRERIGDHRANTRLDFIDEGVAQTRNLAATRDGGAWRQKPAFDAALTTLAASCLWLEVRWIIEAVEQLIS